MKIIEDEIEYTVREYPTGTKIYFLNGKRHRKNGPAAEYADKSKIWYKYGEYHREDGPARIFQDGEERYYLNGKHYPEITSDEEWEKLVLIANIIM